MGKLSSFKKDDPVGYFMAEGLGVIVLAGVVAGLTGMLTLAVVVLFFYAVWKTGILSM